MKHLQRQPFSLITSYSGIEDEVYLKIQSHTCIKTLQIPETHNVKEKGANTRNLNYSGGHVRLQAIYKALYVELRP